MKNKKLKNKMLGYYSSWEQFVSSLEVERKVKLWGKSDNYTYDVDKIQAFCDYELGGREVLVHCERGDREFDIVILDINI